MTTAYLIGYAKAKEELQQELSECQREYGFNDHKLKAELSELKDNESKMNGALSAKQEIINGLKEELSELKNIAAGHDIAGCDAEIHNLRKDLATANTLNKHLLEQREADARVIAELTVDRAMHAREHDTAYKLSRKLAEERDQERAKAQELLEALNWIGAIAVAPKEAWPTQEMCAAHANEAIKRYNSGKGG